MATEAEQLDRISKARLAFARAVIAFHRAACNDDGLLDHMSECEQEYLAVILSRAGLKLDRIRKLATMPVEGRAMN